MALISEEVSLSHGKLHFSHTQKHISYNQGIFIENEPPLLGTEFLRAIAALRWLAVFFFVINNIIYMISNALIYPFTTVISKEYISSS